MVTVANFELLPRRRSESNAITGGTFAQYAIHVPAAMSSGQRHKS